MLDDFTTQIQSDELVAISPYRDLECDDDDEKEDDDDADCYCE